MNIPKIEFVRDDYSGCSKTARLYTCVDTVEPSLVALMIIPISCFYSFSFIYRLRPDNALLRFKFFPYFVSAKSGCSGNAAEMCMFA